MPLWQNGKNALNTQEITYLLQHPESITKQQTNALENILSTYPYFQSARAVYLKGLKNQDSYKYNQALKRTAAYTTDRSILFDFITSASFLQNEVSKNIKHNLENLKNIEVNAQDISSQKSVEIDHALRTQLKETQNILDPELFQPKIEAHQVAGLKQDASISPQKPSPETLLGIGKPLAFNPSEKHSFNEWLKLTRAKPIQREETNTIKEPKASETHLAREQKFELIDKFISTNPKINPSQEVSQSGNMANKRMIQPEALMTETLARIYVEQKNYEKAIQSYKILSLKYPEKSGFFADQIKAIKQLQEDQNTK